MKTLEELLAKKQKLDDERQKIDEQIKNWKDLTVICGRAKLGCEQYANPEKPDEWYISIERVLDAPKTRGSMPRLSIIRSTDRGKCIGYIDEIIKDLQGLKQAIADKEGGKDDD